jgi:catechol-2,3-dioxygenase
MGRRQTIITGKRVAFSTRHLRVSHRDKLRVFGEILGLNMEEALDRALRYGLKDLELEALEQEQADESE